MVGIQSTSNTSVSNFYAQSLYDPSINDGFHNHTHQANEFGQQRGINKPGHVSDSGKLDIQTRLTRNNIVSIAQNYIGSTAWSDMAVNGNYGSGTNKCNEFVAFILSKAGAGPGEPNGWFHKYPPTAGQWADASYNIPGWRVLGSGELPQSGDVVAQKIPYADASGHVMIVGLNRTVIGTGDRGRGPHGTIENILMPKALGPHPSGPMVFRRWTGQ